MCNYINLACFILSSASLNSMQLKAACPTSQLFYRSGTASQVAAGTSCWITVIIDIRNFWNSTKNSEEYNFFSGHEISTRGLKPDSDFIIISIGASWKNSCEKYYGRYHNILIAIGLSS